MGMGTWNSPTQVITPTHPRRRGSTVPRHGSTALRGTFEVSHQSGSTVLWRGSTVPPKAVVPRPDAVVPWAQEDAHFKREKLDLCTNHSEPTRHHKTTQHTKPERHTTNEPTTRHHLSKREGGGRSHLCLSQLVWHHEELSLGP